VSSVGSLDIAALAHVWNLGNQQGHHSVEIDAEQAGVDVERHGRR